MKLTQKRLFTRVSFDFGETDLTYTFDERGATRQLVMDYFELKRSRRHTAQRDWSRFQLGSLLAISGAIAILAQARLVGLNPLAMLWLVPGVAYLGLFLLRQSHFLVVQCGDNPLWIIDDKSRHDIVAELDRRRRERLIDLYGQVNVANEPYLEIRKIEWLVEEAVLTREQADDQIRLVNGLAIARAEAKEEAQQAGGFGMFEREAIAG